MDPLEQHLVQKYNLSPEQAAAYAYKLRTGKDTESMTVKGEAFAPVFADQEQRIKRISYYIDLKKKAHGGGKLSAQESAYLKQVDRGVEDERRVRFQREAEASLQAQERHRTFAQSQRQRALEQKYGGQADAALTGATSRMLGGQPTPAAVAAQRELNARRAAYENRPMGVRVPPPGGAINFDYANPQPDGHPGMIYDVPFPRY